MGHLLRLVITLGLLVCVITSWTLVYDLQSVQSGRIRFYFWSLTIATGYLLTTRVLDMARDRKRQ